MRAIALQASQCARQWGLAGAVPSEQVEVEEVLRLQLALALALDQELGASNEVDCHDVRAGSPSIDLGMEAVGIGDSHTAP